MTLGKSFVVYGCIRKSNTRGWWRSCGSRRSLRKGRGRESERQRRLKEILWCSEMLVEYGKMAGRTSGRVAAEGRTVRPGGMEEIKLMQLKG